MQVDTSPLGVFGKRVSQANQAVFLINSIRGNIGDFRNWRASKKPRYSITIPISDPFFYVLQEWLVSQVNVESQKNLSLKSQTVYHSSGSLDSVGSYDEKLVRVISDERVTITVDGHEILISNKNPVTGIDALRAELIGGNASAEEGPSEPVVVLTANDVEGRDAVLAMLMKLHEESRNQGRKPRLHLLSSYSYSKSSIELPPRPIDSVVLAVGQMERIVEDMKLFISSEREYARKGVHWHRGYLFHGPAGTGKTSLVKALASHFGRDLYYLPMGSIRDDVELTKAFASVPNNSILLLEDVDSFKVTASREDQQDGDKPVSSGISLSGFLNVLDGVMTPHGLMLIMTSNYKERLDPAIIRPGRIDVDETIGVLEGDQAERLFKAFYGMAPKGHIRVEGIAASNCIEIMKRHLFDPTAAELEIRRSLMKKAIA